MVRCLLVLVLWSLLATYLASSLGKYRQGLIGITTTEEPVNEIPVPSVAVCAGVADFRPTRELEPWIQWVAYLHAADNNSDVIWWGNSEAASGSSVSASLSPAQRESLYVDNHGLVLLCNVFETPPDMTLPVGFSNRVRLWP